MTDEVDLTNFTAIIGMAGRFPGAADIASFWQNLSAGRVSISNFDAAQLHASGVPGEIASDPDYVAAAGILDDIAGFDIDLFQFSPAEAGLLDPQQRLFLECAWLALEDAGSMQPDGRQRTGVFGCSDFNTYLPSVLTPNMAVNGATKAFQVEISNDKDFLATRTSYKLDLRGPSMVVQTACSSSLLAVHMASESLLSRACDLALAGGCRIHIPQEEGHLYLAGGVAAAEPHCRPFDARATGTIRGNGVAVVVLKRAEEAVRDGDHIYALILGSAVNNDGINKVGFTAPSYEGQAAVISEALAIAGVAPGEVGYVETHGTGTALGDPIEFAALERALAGTDTGSGRCVLGGLKSNIGHLGSTSGVAGLVKAALAIHNELIPGTPGFADPSPDIPLAGSRFVISAEPFAWPRGQDGRRVAGVSSFGIGGTNCHVVLGEPPELESRPAAGDEPEVIVLSAATPPALQATAARLAARLDSDPPALADLARTLQVGRRPLRYRWARVARSTSEISELLKAVEGPPGTISPVNAAAEPTSSGLCFMFPGQGSEYPGLAIDARQRYPDFARDLAFCADLLAQRGIDLIDFLETGSVSSSMSRTAVVQPALFAVEYCLARLWMSWGMRPTALIGHSVGEFTAAAIAGVFSLADGLALTAARGQAMATMPDGAMVAIRASEQELTELLPEDLCVAAVNAPNSTVVAGPAASVDAFIASLSARSIKAVRLPVDRAFHSSSVTGTLDLIRGAFEDVVPAAPALPVYSGVTGQVLEADRAQSAQYWVEQATSPVRFMECLLSARLSGEPFFLEVGPGTALRGFARATFGPEQASRVASTMGSRTGQERQSTLEGLGAWWQAGNQVDWDLVGTTGHGRRVSLPAYPMERRRCWFGEGVALDGSVRTPASTPVPERAASVALPVPAPEKRAGDQPVTGPAPDLMSEIIAIVASVAGTDQVDPRRPIVEHGLDSLAMLEVIERIRGEFGVKVALADLFDRLGTVAGLVEYLAASPDLRRRPTAPTSAPDTAAASQPTASRQPAGGAEANSSQEPLPSLGPQVFAPPAAGPVTGAQREYLDKFIPRFVERTARSKAHNEAYLRSHADPRNSAGFRPAWKEIVYPIVAERARGSAIWDVDGNRYIDMTMGFGVAFYGHSPDFVADALSAEIERGFGLGPQSALAGVVADQVSALTSLDRVVFTNSGTEAVMASIRLARAFTRRDRIAIFKGSYHGSSDTVLARASAPGNFSGLPTALGVPPGVVSDVVVLDYDSHESLAFIAREGHTLAAVIAEPLQSRRPSLQPIRFLRDVRAITRACGTMLVLDEMITGFRVHPGGLNALWELDADIVTYGKVLGGGLPIGAVAGRADVLSLIDGGTWRYGDSSRPESDLTFFAGTFCKHPLAMAAAHAVLSRMKADGPEVQQELAERTRQLSAGIQQVLDGYNPELRIEQFSSMMYLNTSAAGDLGELVLKGLIQRGVYVWEGRTLFLSTAHSAEDLQGVERIMAEVMEELCAAKVLGRRDAEPAAAPFRLREEQELLWLGAELSPAARAAYNEVLTIPVHGPVSADLVTEAVNQLVQRHGALRLAIDPMARSQVVRSQDPVPLEIIDLGSGPDRWSEGRKHVLRLLETNFDVSHGSLVRALLLRSSGTEDGGRSSEENVVVLVFPHLVVDGWSLTVLRRDFEVLYRSLFHGVASPLPPAPDFADFVRWDSAIMESSNQSIASYWDERLRGISPDSVFTPGPRKERRYLARFHRIPLGDDAAERLRTLCVQLTSTPYVIGLTALFATMAAATGRSSLVVAGTLAGQPHFGEPDLVGYCLKVLPLRVSTAGAVTFADLARRTNQAVREAVDNWHVSELSLIKKYWPAVDGSRPPLGGVHFELENVDPPAILPGTTRLDVDLAEITYTKWDVSLVLVDHGGPMVVELVYDPDVVSAEVAIGLAELYVTILRAAWEDPGLRLSEYLTSAARPRPGTRRPLPLG